ncbi:hypothetical protein MH117_24470 [Paenibacillus sp. ACRRX]|uniref:hypothetical protein n=1 Tax=Paenibacillus sp. ACRRX TaxID=2918206 RepID=UPI001EF48731|nr:hypothetical protein [Paenibacillus sp. ACRRX]MCG7410555.1 hypothetical protein [Paenibacillus sp. ACRRX]
MGFWKKLKDDVNVVKQRQQKSMFIDYLGGHPEIKPGKVFVIQGGSNHEILIDNHPITITKLEWDEKGTRSAGKAAAGAIVGGVLTGGIGLLAGAAVGGRKEDNSLAIITYGDVIERQIFLRANKDEYAKLSSLI